MIQFEIQDKTDFKTSVMLEIIFQYFPGTFHWETY